jgi:hypothetical protein
MISPKRCDRLAKQDRGLLSDRSDRENKTGAAAGRSFLLRGRAGFQIRFGFGRSQYPVEAAIKSC